MRAAVFEGDGVVRLADVPEPRVEADDDVLIGAVRLTLPTELVIRASSAAPVTTRGRPHD